MRPSNLFKFFVHFSHPFTVPANPTEIQIESPRKWQRFNESVTNAQQHQLRHRARSFGIVWRIRLGHTRNAIRTIAAVPLLFHVHDRTQFARRPSIHPSQRVRLCDENVQPDHTSSTNVTSASGDHAAVHQRTTVLGVHLRASAFRTTADRLGSLQSAPLPRVDAERNRNGERCTAGLHWNLYGKILVTWSGRAVGAESFQCEAHLRPVQCATN